MSNVIELDPIAWKTFEVGYIHPATYKQISCGELKVYRIPEFIERMEQAGVPAYVGGDTDKGVEELWEYLLGLDNEQTTTG
jgi:hypothetical protein